MSICDGRDSLTVAVGGGDKKSAVIASRSAAFSGTDVPSPTAKAAPVHLVAYHGCGVQVTAAKRPFRANAAREVSRAGERCVRGRDETSEFVGAACVKCAARHVCESDWAWSPLPRRDSFEDVVVSRTCACLATSPSTTTRKTRPASARLTTASQSRFRTARTLPRTFPHATEPTRLRHGR